MLPVAEQQRPRVISREMAALRVDMCLSISRTDTQQGLGRRPHLSEVECGIAGGLAGTNSSPLASCIWSSWPLTVLWKWKTLTEEKNVHPCRCLEQLSQKGAVLLHSTDRHTEAHGGE